MQHKYVTDSTSVMLFSVSKLLMYQTIHFLQATQVCDGFNTSYASQRVFIYDVSNHSFLAGNTSM